MKLDPQISAHRTLLESHAAPGPVVAFFDMDRTLIQGYSAVALVLEAVLNRQPGMSRMARELLANIERPDGGRHYTGLYRKFIASLAGTPESDLAELGEKAYQRSLAASIFRETRQVVAMHRQLGHEVVIVSAATRYQVEPVARALGIDHICCTRLKVRSGRLTGELCDTLCHGEGKVTAARKTVRRLGASLQSAWFYSDSSDDMPLLKKVGQPVATNPSASLEHQALERGWPILNFCSRGKPNLESVLRTVMMGNVVVSTAAAGAASWLVSRSSQRARNQMTSFLGGLGSAFAGLEFEIEGTRHLESVRPAIFTFNHQSYLDSVVMAQLLRHDFVAFCKREVAQNKLLGPLLKAHGTIFVDREAADQSLCLEQARAALLEGKSLAIAPEGARSATGELLEFRPGAFYLAKKMGIPIVPVVLHNVADALPKGRWLLRPATIEVTVMPPIAPAELGNLRLAAGKLRKRYQSVLDDELSLSTRFTNFPISALDSGVSTAQLSTSSR